MKSELKQVFADFSVKISRLFKNNRRRNFVEPKFLTFTDHKATLGTSELPQKIWV